MKHIFTILGLAAGLSQAAVVNLSPSDINLGDTNTTVFSNGDLTLTPFNGGVATTFNGNATRLGVDDAGTSNNNAFNDPDIDPSNGNEETLQFEFSPTSGLSRIAYDFSRADGPGDQDGVIITGFVANPNVTFSVIDPNLFASYNSIEGSVRLNIPGSLFNGNDVDINFNPQSSAGQTLLLSVTDTTQAGAQLAITGISYDNSVPEPSSVMLLGLAGLGLLRRRR
jgi:hypothetical protein